MVLLLLSVLTTAEARVNIWQVKHIKDIQGTSAAVCSKEGTLLLLIQCLLLLIIVSRNSV